LSVLSEDPTVAVEVLELHRVTAEYGRHIHPCKACFSTSPALCHWPCSCYPNYSLGQTQDWMNEIYPLWVAAHGILIVTPVNWYQVSSPVKLMMDRLVCADGGNPDPSRTHGKDAAQAKAIELEGWDYPRHLAGRATSVTSSPMPRVTPSSTRIGRCRVRFEMPRARYSRRFSRSEAAG
jgi:multimeric flavodoxin WrbA